MAGLYAVALRSEWTTEYARVWRDYWRDWHMSLIYYETCSAVEANS